MKIFLTAFFVGLNLLALGQTVVKSMQTIDNEKVLDMNIVGQRDGHPFKHKIHFDVAGMTQIQCDSLYQQTVRALAILGIKDVPGMRKPGSEAEPRGEEVVFSCETCKVKGSVEIYQGDFVLMRSFNSKRDTKSFFPLTLRLGSGEYRLVYRETGSRKRESNFSVRANEVNEINIK